MLTDPLNFDSDWDKALHDALYPARSSAYKCTYWPFTKKKNDRQGN